MKEKAKFEAHSFGRIFKFHSENSTQRKIVTYAVFVAWFAVLAASFFGLQPQTPMGDEIVVVIHSFALYWLGLNHGEEKNILRKLQSDDESEGKD